MAVTSGTVLGNNVDGTEGSYFDWQIVPPQIIVGNYTRITWQVGWRFDASRCRGLGQGSAVLDGATVYNNGKPGNGVHTYNSGHDHRPKLLINSGTRDLIHAADGSRSFSASVQMTGFSGLVSFGTASFVLPDIVPILAPLGQPGTVNEAQPLNVVTIGLTPVSPQAQETVFSHRPSFRIGVFAPVVTTVAAVGAVMNLDVQYTPATDLAYSDAQFDTAAVAFSRVLTLTSRYSEVVVAPDVDLPAGVYHWRMRWQTGSTSLSGWTPGPTFAFSVADPTPYPNNVHWSVSASSPEALPHLWRLVPARGEVGDSIAAYGYGFPATSALITIVGVPAPILEWHHNDATPAGATEDRVIAPGVLIDCEHDVAVVAVPDINEPGARFVGGPFVIGPALGYQVSGRYLSDPRSFKQIVVGVEQRLEHLAWIPDGPDILPEIAKTGASTCRILVNYSSGAAYTVAEIDASIAAGLNGGMFIELAIDGGKNPDIYRSPEILKLIKKWQYQIAIHAVGESEAVTDTDWATEAKLAIGKLRQAGIVCPLYVVSRVFGRSLTCILNKGAEVQAADPLHNTVFGWQAYWGQPPGTPNPMTSTVGVYQQDNNMTLLQALDYCAAASFPIQIGLMHHSDPDLPAPDNALVIPYSEMMAALRARNLGWLWWDYREGPDNFTPSGDYGDWTVYGQNVVVSDPNGIAQSAVRTGFLTDQEGAY